MLRSPKLLRAAVLAFAACAGLAATALAHAQPAPALPPLEHFFDNPEFSAAQLSPSGKYLAARFGVKGARERLAVVDLSNNSARMVAHFSDADVGHFSWISEERILFDSTDKRIGQGDVRYGPGLYAVNRDGTDFRQLAERNGRSFIVSATARKMLPWHTFMLAQRGAQESEFVYVRSPQISGPGEVHDVGLLRLNTLNGRTTEVERPGDTREWLLDHKGEPRLASSVEKGVTTLHYRDPPAATGGR